MTVFFMKDPCLARVLHLEWRSWVAG
jgi:hypothetical protein